MDELVRQALIKWPNVPACWGWLGLDQRGAWWLRDAQTQEQGAFPYSKGSRVEHEKLLAFIGRNYDVDAHGAWFFQNGPQRVYVELESTPMVWRVHEDSKVFSHTGRLVQQVQACVMDEEGRVYLQGDGVLGIVHSQDMLPLAQCIEAGIWTVQEVRAELLPQRFGFVRSPQQAQNA